MLGFGFGFVEVGTLTPAAAAGQSQAAPVPAGRGRGGDQPDGLQQWRARRAALRRLARARRRTGIVGVNIGANKDSADRIADYAAGVRGDGAGRRLSHGQHLLAQHAGPARAAGRRRARRAARRRSLEARGAAARRSSSRSRPISSRREIDAIARIALDARARRADRRQHHAQPAAADVAPSRRGGRPVGRAAEARSRWQRLRDFRSATGGALPLIAAGGIASGAGRLCADPRRREPGPALHRFGLSRARPRARASAAS